MVKTLDPRNLLNRMRHFGPYLFFYNTDIYSSNDKMIEYINKLSSEYPKLSVFQLDWKLFKKIYPMTPPEETDKIFLYSKSKIIDEKFKHNKEDIDDIFKEAIKLHNIKIENKAKNIGMKGIKVDIKNDSSEIYLKKRLLNNESKRKCILKNKLIFKHNSNKSVNEILKRERSSWHNEFSEKAKIQNFKNIENQTLTKKIKNFIDETSLDRPWFYTPNAIDLPSKILSNDFSKKSKRKVTKKPECVLNSNILGSKILKPQKYTVKNPIGLKSECILSNKSDPLLDSSVGSEEVSKYKISFCNKN